MLAAKASPSRSAHLALEHAASAERGEACHRVGGRTAGDLPRIAECRVKLRRAMIIDQRHHALCDVVRQEELVVDRRQHVDNRAAENRHVVCVCH